MEDSPKRPPDREIVVWVDKGKYNVNMELHHLRYVVAVAKHQSFSRAAEEIPVSVASVSDAIKRLEMELGVVLFERTSRRVRTTLAGEIFLHRVAKALSEIEAVKRDLEQFRSLQAGRVVLGTPPVPAVPNLAAFLASFRRDYPAIQVRLLEASSGRLIEALRNHEVDISFITGYPGSTPDDLEAIELDRWENGVALPPDHSLALRDTVELATLSNLVMVIHGPGYAQHDIALEVCRRTGIQPFVALEITGPEMLCELVRAGLGFTILPKERAQTEGLAFVRCMPRPLDRVLTLAWLRGRSLPQPARLLRDKICETLRDSVRSGKPFDEHDGVNRRVTARRRAKIPVDSGLGRVGEDH